MKIISENGNVGTSEENAEEVGNVTLQAVSEGDVKTSQMYPKLDSLAREAGIYLPLQMTTFYFCLPQQTPGTAYILPCFYLSTMSTSL